MAFTPHSKPRFTPEENEIFSEFEIVSGFIRMITMKECSESSAVLTVVDNARNIYDSMVNKHDQLRENNYSKSHKVTQQHFSWIEESFQVLRQTNNF